MWPYKYALVGTKKDVRDFAGCNVAKAFHDEVVGQTLSNLERR